MFKARRVFFAIQGVMIALSLIAHAWVVWRGFVEDGPGEALIYFFLFVYAELYWAWRSFQAEGISLFFALTAAIGAWWLGLLLFRQVLRKRVMPQTEPETQ